MKRRFDLGSSFGVMQGRLSAQTDRGYQSFPWESWQKEFTQAADRRLEHIEWVLDSWHVEDNPILKNPDEIQGLSAQSGVDVASVCADYLMDRPLDVDDSGTWTVLELLLDSMQLVGARYLIIPCVDQASLRKVNDRSRFARAAERISELVSGSGVEVALETDLGPDDFVELINELDPCHFGVNYDIGNSASLGFRPDEEFDAYGERISLVHIKDRIRGGGSVPLGEGSADVPQVLVFLEKLNFSGPVTMQVYRDIPGVEVLDQQLEWMDQLLSRSP